MLFTTAVLYLAFGMIYGVYSLWRFGNDEWRKEAKKQGYGALLAQTDALIEVMGFPLFGAMFMLIGVLGWLPIIIMEVFRKDEGVQCDSTDE